MKIDSETALVDLVGYLKSSPETVKEQAAPTKNESPQIQSDTVEISNRSQETIQVREVIDQVKDVREEKVDELRSAVQSGTYGVNGEEVADGIIGESIVDIVL